MRKVLFAAVSIMAMSTAAHADWHVASSEHFVVYANDTPEELKKYTTRLERFDKAMRILWNLPPQPIGKAGRVTIFTVKSLSDIQRLAGPGGDNVAGFYQARASGPVAFVPAESGRGEWYRLSPEQVMLHEYSHHFMYSSWPTAAYPKWFSEGFAEYSMTAIFRPDGSVIFGAPAAARGIGMLESIAMPASLMLKTDQGKLDQKQQSILYSRGWLLTHFLLNDPARRKQLSTYINAINTGQSADSVVTTFGDPRALDGKLNSYAKSASFASFQVPAEKLAIGEVSVRPITAGEAATIGVKIRSTRGVDKTLAPAVAEAARRAAAPFPNDAFAQNVLAEAEYDAASLSGDKADYTLAAAAVDRALAADPKSIHALLYRGMILQAKAEQDKATDAATWAAVRKAYIAANRQDPDDPQPLLMFYKTFGAQGIEPPQSAIDGLYYAYALAPFDSEVRVMAARAFLKQGKGALARQALLPVVYSPHSGSFGEKLKAVVATLDKDGAAAAHAQLGKLEDEQRAKAKSGTGSKDS